MDPETVFVDKLDYFVFSYIHIECTNCHLLPLAKHMFWQSRLSGDQIKIQI